MDDAVHDPVVDARRPATHAIALNRLSACQDFQCSKRTGLPPRDDRTMDFHAEALICAKKARCMFALAGVSLGHLPRRLGVAVSRQGRGRQRELGRCDQKVNVSG